MLPGFYTTNSNWPDQIETIVELLGRVSAVEELTGHGLELRRANRIGSVHSSTAIEGNALTLSEVEEVANGKPIYASPRDVREVENALAAYDALEELDPWSIDDFLRAHKLLTIGLVAESGEFRTVDVDIVSPSGEVLHSGSRYEKVPMLVEALFEWGSTASDHPLIVGSATHFLIEHIHPFRDGNGRIGRLWQTLILSRWRSVLAWMPTETLIRRNQAGYYTALQASREPEIDAAPFIDFMLRVVTESLRAYEARARQGVVDVGVNVGVNVGVDDALLAMLRETPTLSAVDLARRLGKTSRTIERHIAQLKRQGRLRREGPAKGGVWVVIDEDS